MLRYQPSDSLDFLFIAQWGKDRSDAFHTTNVDATNVAIPDSQSTVKEPRGYYEAKGFQRDPRNALVDVCNMPGLLGPNTGQPEDRKRSGQRRCEPLKDFWTSDGEYSLDLMSFSLRSTWELEASTFKAISAYGETQSVNFDGSRESSVWGADDVWQASQELIFEGEGEDYTWKTGGFYMHDRVVHNENSKAFGGQQAFQDYKQISNTWNVGIQAKYDFLEEGAIPGLYQLSVEFSSGYTWEHKVMNLGAKVEIPNETGGAQLITLPRQTERKLWNNAAGHFALMWKPVESATIFAKYSRGQKAGHFNAGLYRQTGRGTKQTITPVHSEHIHAAEMGMNSSFFGGIVTFDVTAFRYWYENYQVYHVVNEPNTVPTNQLLNADTNVIGFEAEGSFEPIWWLLEGLKLTGTFGWSDSEFTDFVVSKVVVAGQKNPPRPPRTANFDFSGYPLIASPEWSTSAIASWEFPIFEYGTVTPAYDCNYRSKLYFDPSFQQALAQDPYWLHNARIAYTSPNEVFEVSFWVENIFKKEYKVDAFDVTRVDQVIAESWGEPRMYGISLSLNW